MSDTPPVDTEACTATSPLARNRYAKRGIILEMPKQVSKPIKSVRRVKHSAGSLPERVKDLCKNELDLARSGGKQPDAEPLCICRYAGSLRHIGNSSELVLSQLAGWQQLSQVCATLPRTVPAKMAQQEVAHA